MLKLPKIESVTVEFKATFNEDVIETLVAFANTKGGTVYVGVPDKGKIQGIAIGKETVQNWINEVKTKTRPQIVPDVEALGINGKDIVALSVPEYPIKPIGKSRRDNTLLTVGFNLRQYGIYHRVPQGWHFLRQVSSLRDLVEERLPRRLKPTVNKVLSLRDWGHVFGKCSIERYGSGIIRVRKICKDYGVREPDFQERGNGFLVTLYNEKVGEQDTNKDTNRDTNKDAVTLTDVQKIIMNEMANNKAVTMSEISKVLNINLRNTKNNVAKLKAKGLIERVGADRGGYWKVKEVLAH